MGKVRGNGQNTSVWHHKWVCEGTLVEKYQKESKIQACGGWRDGVWSWQFSWRQNWLEWEKLMVEKLMEEVSSFRLVEQGRSGFLALKYLHLR